MKWGVWAERKTKAATDIGTAFHYLVEGKDLQPSKRVEQMVKSFLNWSNQNGLKVKESELHVISERYHYHGTFDAVGRLGKSKQLVLFDWKTSSGIYPDMALQLSAYAQAYKEQCGIEIKRGIIVLVSKDKPYHKLTVKEYTLGPKLFKKFLKRLNEYREIKGATSE